MKKNLIIIATALLLSVGLGYLFNSGHDKDKESLYAIIDTSQAIFPQEVASQSDEPVEVTKLYREKKLVGIIHDETRLESMFNDVYVNEYSEEFPDSKLDFIDDLFQIKELSYNVYEDRDDDIFNYIHEENLFAIEVNKVEFSNGAIIYVKNMDDFNAARETFILNFISQDAYNKLKNDEPIAPLLTYGTREVGLTVDPDRVVISKGLASKENIMLNETDVLTFLSYGYDPVMETYVVKEYDTVAGVGWYYGMNANQIVSINADKIKNENQFLNVGMELNVTKFNSPFAVTVQRERMTSEVVYAEKPLYKSDPTLREGIEIVDVEEANGFADVVYRDTYVNSDATDSEQISYRVVVDPVQSVIRYGTYVEPKIGSGIFRWPMNNAYVMCRHGCYPGHKGTDLAARGGNYGPIYSIDRGVVSKNSYDAGGWGYYIVIDHGNGYTSLYAHMQSPGYFPVGSTVGKGDNIGYVGMTGRTFAPHVHLEVRRGGRIINACSVIGC